MASDGEVVEGQAAEVREGEEEGEVDGNAEAGELLLFLSQLVDCNLVDNFQILNHQLHS